MFPDRQNSNSFPAGADLPGLPNKHQISRLDPGVISAWEEKLAALDEGNLLDHRRPHLARLLSTIEGRGLVIGREISLFECGPFHEGWGNGPYNGGVPRFMAEHALHLGLRYKSFEPKLSEELLLEALQRREETANIAARLTQKILRDSVPSYMEFARQALEEKEHGRSVVIFSNYVLSDPDLRQEFPFWTLPGLHVHSAAYEEIGQYRLRSELEPMFNDRMEREEARVRIEGHRASFKTLLWDMDIDPDHWVWERVLQEAWRNDPLAHLEMLRTTLGLGDVSISCDTSAPYDLMFYTWETH